MKRALVTGGSGGIGAAICRKLAAQGCEVLVHANSQLDRAEAVAAEIRAAGGSARANSQRTATPASAGSPFRLFREPTSRPTRFTGRAR